MGVVPRRRNRVLDQTNQFFSAGELMELSGDFGDGDPDRYEPEVSSARRWFAFAAASAVALLAVLIWVG